MDSKTVNTAHVSGEKIDTSWEVTGLAGYSKDGKTIYIDKRFKRHLTLKNGQVIDCIPFLVIHEATEKQLEDEKGMSYQVAHEKATGVERKAVEAAGIPWDEYQKYALSEVKRLKDLDPKAPVPKDYDLKPERDYCDYNLIRTIKEHQKMDKAVNFLNKLTKAGGEGSRGGNVIGHTEAGKPVYDGDEHPAGFHIISRDTTDQKHHELWHGNTLVERHPEWDKIKTMHDKLTNKIKKSKFLKKLTKSIWEVDGDRIFYEVLNDLEKGWKLEDAAKFKADLIKGGPGSGQKGHTTARMDYPKLPKPGENLPLVSEPKAEEKVDQKQTYIPPEGTTPHYSDTKEMYVYKKILTYFKQNGIVPHGHISFDPKANKIITITNKGRQILSELATKGK